MGRHQRAKAEISTTALRENLTRLRSRFPESGIMAMVKANAYGHGIRECSSIFRVAGAEFLGVAFMEEAAALRSYGDDRPILVLTAPLPSEAADYCEHAVDFAACSPEVVRAFSGEAERRGREVNAHLYLDTGMHRDGIDFREAVGFMRSVGRLPYIRFTGVCTHFATSEQRENGFARVQLDRFRVALNALHDAGFRFQHIHAANSGALGNLAESVFTLVRPGSALYGYNAAEDLRERFALQPAMRLVAYVNAVRSIAKGESVSYGRQYFAPRDTRIATIPIGYGDGYPRCLSGKAQCLINGKRFDIVGTICMDECMADIGDADIRPGAETVLIGTQGAECIPATEVARKAGTIHYEILSGITARVPRVFV